MLKETKQEDVTETEKKEEVKEIKVEKKKGGTKNGRKK